MNTNTANKLTAIAQNQQKVYDAGHTKGYSEAENDFWDAFQANGTRTSYQRAFGCSAWNDITFKPKYDIVPKKVSDYIFAQCNVTDLAATLERLGVVLDLSQSTGYYQFYNTTTTRIPRVDLRAAKYYNQTFADATRLVTIDAVVSSEVCKWGNAFSNCKVLENLTIEGTIGKNGFSVSGSPKLSHDSLMSIINALADYHGDGLIHTVTLGEVNLAKLTDAEKAIATERGWTLA